MHLWEDGVKLKEEMKFLMFNRPGVPELLEEQYPINYVCMNLPEA